MHRLAGKFVYVYVLWLSMVSLYENNCVCVGVWGCMWLSACGCRCVSVCVGGCLCVSVSVNVEVDVSLSVGAHMQLRGGGMVGFMVAR